MIRLVDYFLEERAPSRYAALRALTWHLDILVQADWMDAGVHVLGISK